MVNMEVPDRVFSVTLILTLLVIFAALSANGSPSGCPDLLRNRFEVAEVAGVMFVGKEPVYASAILPGFYEDRGYELAWSEGGDLLDEAGSLVKMIKGAGKEGLTLSDYHLRKIEDLRDKLKMDHNSIGRRRNSLLVDIDLLLTDAFLVLGSHLLIGKVDSEAIDPDWFSVGHELDLTELLCRALSSGDIEGTLKGILPRQAGYGLLRLALSRLKEADEQGGWGTVPGGDMLRKGDTGERVGKLSSYLEKTGDLQRGGKGKKDRFDDDLDFAVRRFQKRHGLKADGIIGPLVLSAMRIPVERRIRQVEINMERWRWLPEDLGSRRLMVNIADFGLEVIEGDSVIMDMRVIVGRDYRKTPVFSDLMTSVVFNPYWHIPPTLAQEDLLPLVMKNPGYLSGHSIRVLRGWGSEAVEVDPRTVDWSGVQLQDSDIRFRQDPGPSNPLGRMKFMFPNKFNIYLHDTPEKELFEEGVRNFSSGCIRIEKPFELAGYLLQADSAATSSWIAAALKGSVDMSVPIPDPIPVHILYWTAWVGPDGLLNFREDIYCRDLRLEDAFYAKPPKPGSARRDQ